MNATDSVFKRALETIRVEVFEGATPESAYHLGEIREILAAQNLYHG